MSMRAMPTIETEAARPEKAPCNPMPAGRPATATTFSLRGVAAAAAVEFGRAAIPSVGRRCAALARATAAARGRRFGRPVKVFPGLRWCRRCGRRRSRCSAGIFSAAASAQSGLIVVAVGHCRRSREVAVQQCVCEAYGRSKASDASVTFGARDSEQPSQSNFAKILQLNRPDTAHQRRAPLCPCRIDPTRPARRPSPR